MAGYLRESDIEGHMTPRERELFRALIQGNRINFMTLLLQSPQPAGAFDKAMTGDAIGTTDKYITLVAQNKRPNPIAVTIYAQFSGIPGKQVKISLTTNQSDDQVVDYLGNTPASPSFNKRRTDPVILNPGDALYINTADTNFALVVGDKFLVRIFDPARALNEEVWQTR